MNRMKGRILVGLVSLVIITCALPAASASTSTPRGYLAGEQFLVNVDHEFETVDLGDGTAIYKSDSHTLTLNNVSMNLEPVQAGISTHFLYTSSMEELIVELQGTNTIVCNGGDGILMDYAGSLTIKGNGTLSLTTRNDAINVPNKVEVTDGATLNLNPQGDHSAIRSANMNNNSDVKLQNGAKVTISSEGTASAVVAHGNVKLAGGSTLTINAPAVSKTRAIPVAIEAPRGSITVANSTLNVTGQIAANTGITIQDASDLDASEVIVDGGIQPAPLTVRPATGKWMQVHASVQTGGDLEVEDYFDAEKTYPNTDGLFNLGYVHIQAHEHVETWCGDITSHWKECSSCGALLTGKEEHAYGEWVAEELTHWKQCSVCNMKVEESHNATTDWQQEEDYHWYGCTTCGAMNEMEDHKFVWTVDQAPTETTPGVQHGVCSVCQYRVDNVAIPTTGHTQHIFGTDWATDETNHWHVCTAAGCGEIADEAAHTFAWVTDREATETTPGSKHEQCTVCGYAKAPVEIPANPSAPNPPVENPPAENPPAGGSTTGSANVPKTGDNTPIALWLTLLLASGTAIAVLAKRKLYNR